MAVAPPARCVRLRAGVGRLAAGLIAVVLCLACGPGAPRPEVEAGRLDLSAWEFERGDVELHGRWSVCWSALLEPGHDCPSGWSTAGVRGIWSDDSARSPFGGKGVATYRVRIALPSEREDDLLLAAGAPLVASRIWINGEARLGSGVVGPDAETTSSVPLRNRVHRLPANARELDVLVQVANFEFRGGGLRRPWFIGDVESIERRNGLALLRDAVLSVICLLFGIASLVQFGLRRQEVVRLWFGLFALVMAARIVPSGLSGLSGLIVPWASFEWVTRLEYLGTSGAILFGAAYLAAKTPDLLPPRTVGFLQLSALAISPVILLGSFDLVMATLPFFLIMPPLSFGLAIAIYLRAWWRGREDVRVTLVASLVFVVSIVHDVIRTVVTDFGFNVELFGYFFVVWLGAEAFELAGRLMGSLEREEALSEELSELNFELQATESVLTPFVPFELLSLLEKTSIRDVSVGDRVGTAATVLHCDWSDQAGRAHAPRGSADLNERLRRAAECIRDEGGIVEERGAAHLLGIFREDAEAATRAGLAIRSGGREGGDGALAPGLGIATGPIALTVLGGDERLVGSVVGPAAVEAERLARDSASAGGPLLVSGTTRAAWPDEARFGTRRCHTGAGSVAEADGGDPIYDVSSADGLD